MTKNIDDVLNEINGDAIDKKNLKSLYEIYLHEYEKCKKANLIEGNDYMNLKSSIRELSGQY